MNIRQSLHDRIYAEYPQQAKEILLQFPLKKSYSADIHLWHNGKWDKSGELSQGRAYGVSLPWNNSLLIIGGETAGGKAVTDSVFISVKDNKVTVQN